MKELFVKYIIDLYKDVPNVVYEGLVIVFCIGVVMALCFYGFKKGLQLLSGLILAEYVFFLLCMTIIFRIFKENQKHDYHPFWSYVAIHDGREQLLPKIIMNVAAFVPVGILSGCLFRSMTWRKVFLIGSGLSMVIEVMQLSLKRGFAEMDDVIHNTLGCLIGFMIVSIIKGIWSLQKRYSMN